MPTASTKVKVTIEYKVSKPTAMEGKDTINIPVAPVTLAGEEIDVQPLDGVFEIEVKPYSDSGTGKYTLYIPVENVLRITQE